MEETNGKLKIDIYIPLNACACEWDKFMNRVFEVITPYIIYIVHNTKSLDSEEARKLNLHRNSVVVDGTRIFNSSYILKKELPKILQEKGLL